MDILTVQWGFIGGYKPEISPVPPAPVVEIVEQRRWPGPSIVLYRETDVIPNWQRKREDEEIVIL